MLDQSAQATDRTVAPDKHTQYVGRYAVHASPRFSIEVKQPVNDHHTAIDDRPMARHVAEQFATALDLAYRPETLGEWVDLTATRLDRAGVSVGPAEMCLTDTSPHRARMGEETQYFSCVLDTLLVPFVLERSVPIEIRTRSPVSERRIDVEVSEGAVRIQPARAVMSVGIAADTPPPGERGGLLADLTGAVCPYIEAFANRSEYEEWAEETPDAVTMALPVADGFALASALGRELPTDRE